MSAEILWTPSAQKQENSALWDFATKTHKFHGAEPGDYATLLNWSNQQPEEFYSELWDYLGVIGDKGDQAVHEHEMLRETRFFPNASINYAENLLRNPDDQLAIIAHRDDGTRRELSRKDLYDLVSQIAQALTAEGIKEGDRIAAIVTNDIESIAAYLAVAALGAVWCSCSPDFGPTGASDRLNQVAPKLLLAVPGYSYAGKNIDTSASINAVATQSSISRIIILGAKPQNAHYEKSATGLSDWLQPFPPKQIEFNRGPFNRPMVILFSSGTTGKPKCIVHSGGGFLVQHMKEQVLQCDIKMGERFFYFTTCGWMMWNWLVSGLALRATLVTFDGNPFHPHASRLIDMIDQEQINIFGTSAKYIDACSKADLKPLKTHSLSSLKAILSTGSPLLPENFDYIYRDWKADLHLASISGGTDIGACFVGGVPTLPVRRGEIQAAQLGMDVDALDDEGHAIIGQPGEFVCRNAHVSMPVFFWDDKDGARYHEAYFAKYDNLWAHGDYVEKRPNGGFVIHGRSDTTLNPGGVRIGTAEIYRQVETINDILEAIVVGQNWDGDQRVILFVRLKPDAQLTDELIKSIRTRIRAGATPRHVPAKIVAVPDIPRTRSGKISEIAVRDTIERRPIKNTTALANAACLKFYENWAQSDDAR